MACSEKILLLISSYADGEATHDESVRAKAHLAECSSCRKMVEDWNRQKQLFEWAFTFDLPEEVGFDYSGQAASIGKSAKSRKRGAQDRMPRKPIRDYLRWNWSKAGALAAAVICAFIVYYVAKTPLLFDNNFATTKDSEIVRVANGIELKVAPNTKIVRVNKQTIKLTQGSFIASVKHGTDFRVVTNRMEVIDIGTVFEVGTGSNADCVSVEKGDVVVKRADKSQKVVAKQALIVSENGNMMKFSASDIPADEGGYPLKKDARFRPTSAEDLNWADGLDRLAKRFPDLKKDGMSRYGGMDLGDMSYRFYRSSAIGVSKGLKDHFNDIVKAMAGVTIDSEDWEVPVGFTLVDGIKSPVALPRDTYCISLVCQNGTLMWRFDSSGNDHATLPVTFEKVDSDYWDPDGALITYTPSISTSDVDVNVKMAIAYWPAKLKPMMHLKLDMAPTKMDEKQLMIADTMQKLAVIYKLDLNKIALGTADQDSERRQLASFKPNQDEFRMEYLDAGRNHKILISTNNGFGDRYLHVLERMKQGLGGSVLVGVVSTEVPFIYSPKFAGNQLAPAGVYLLWWIAPGGSKKPHWHITSPDISCRAVLSDAGSDISGSVSDWFDNNVIYEGDKPSDKKPTVTFRVTTMDEESSSLSFKLNIYSENQEWDNSTNAGWICFKKP